MFRFPKNIRLREPLLIVLLSVLASIFFAATHAYTRAYDQRRAGLGRQWFDNASAELHAGRPGSAVGMFQTALRYAPENWDYRLQLAKALTAANRSEEALAYYQSLWQSNPGNGSVNLQLARIAAETGNREEAERYFNGAIFGIWDSDAAENRREALFEMIDFYMQQSDLSAAESELIVLAANLPMDANLHERVARLFLRVNDNERAMAEFRDALLIGPKNAPALRGAAQAAFRLSRFGDTKELLDRSLRLDPENEDARNLLYTTTAILSLDPLDGRIRSAEKADRVVHDFEVAGDRLNACVIQLQSVPSVPSAVNLGDLAEKWMTLAPGLKAQKLRNDADLSQQAVELIFSIEQQTNSLCGPPAPGPDMALLTIARERSR